MSPVIVVGGIALGIGILAAALGGKSKGKKPKPSSVVFKRGPGGLGWVFGSGCPAAFNYASNNLWISLDCTSACCGEMFWPGPDALPPGQGPPAEEADTLDAVLSIPGNTALGFIDYLIQQEGLEQAEEIAARVITEISPLCADVDPNVDWGDGLRLFHEWLLIRLVPYVDEWVHGIEPEDIGAGARGGDPTTVLIPPSKGKGAKKSRTDLTIGRPRRGKGLA
jgi:hypothetical protein